MSRDEEVHLLPDPRREPVDRGVVGAELDGVEEGRDPGVGLAVRDRAEGFAECEFAEHCILVIRYSIG